ncbi:carbon-nitrogen family hydrolase [Desulfococcaceae bacterium HSG7]|nr:carbon-nitrogen family hydrolase [Desulfococcaceae bacterium HSG7]
MKVASIQMSVVEGDKTATIDKAVENIRWCAGSDLVILPEIWNIGFMSFDSYLAEAEDNQGMTLTRLREAAKESEVYLHTGSFVEEKNGQHYNSSYLISPDGNVLANYLKIHLFGYNSKETQILSPGDSIVTVETPLGKIGMATCYDLRFPELFRKMVDQGAEIFLICSAWPYPRLEAWQMLNRVRALENQCYLISANSTGFNQGIQFVGHSMVTDPWGTVIAGAGDKEVIIKTEIDRKEVEMARQQFPALSDRKNWLRNHND